VNDGHVLAWRTFREVVCKRLVLWHCRWITTCTCNITTDSLQDNTVPLSLNDMYESH